MSFAAETKNELSRLEPEKKCCQLAEIAGFLRVSGSIRLAGGGRFKIVTATDNPAVARHYKRLIKEYFNVETALEIGDAQVEIIFRCLGEQFHASGTDTHDLLVIIRFQRHIEQTLPRLGLTGIHLRHQLELKTCLLFFLLRQ